MSSENSPPMTPERDGEQFDFIDIQNVIDIEENSKNISDDSKWDLMFKCIGQFKNLKEKIGQNSYIGSSALSNLYLLQSPFNNIHLNDIKQVQILHEDIQHYMMLIRKNLQTMRKKCGGNGDNNSEAYKLRMTVEILSNISILLQILNDGKFTQIEADYDTSFSYNVSLELVKLLNFIGPINILSQNFITSSQSNVGNETSNPLHHLFHLYLDIRWWVLAILHQIETTNRLKVHYNDLSEEQFISMTASNMDFCFNFLIRDVVDLILHQSEKCSNNLKVKVSSFPCECCLELAISTLHIIKWHHMYRQKESFWSRIARHVEALINLKRDKMDNQLESSENLRSFYYSASVYGNLKSNQIWFVFFNVASFFQYDLDGRVYFSDANIIETDPQTLRSIILSTIVNCEFYPKPNEQELRYFTQHCWQLLLLWQRNKVARNSHWISALWDYFSQHLDSNFLLNRGSLEGFGNNSKSPVDLVTSTLRLLDKTANDNLAPSRISSIENFKNFDLSSYEIFLKILSEIFKKDTEWRLMKGRIFSKFHVKKFENMSENSLYHTTQLFVVVAYSIQSFDCSDSDTLCLLYDLLLHVGNSSGNKICAVFMSFLSFAYLYATLKKDIDVIAQKIEQLIRNIKQTCINLREIDQNKRREIGYSLTMFCKWGKEILACNREFSFGRNLLFSSSLNSFVSIANSRERNSILDFLDRGLKYVLSCTANYSEMSRYLKDIWNNFKHTLKLLWMSKDVLTNLPQVCANLVLCALKLRVNLPSEYKEINNFLNFINSSPVISENKKDLYLKFLKILIENEDYTILVGQIFPNIDMKCIESLLSNVIENGNSEELITTAEVIFDRVTSLKKLTNQHTPSCVFGKIHMLINNMIKEYQDGDILIRKSLKSKSKTYFSSLKFEIKRLLKRQPLPVHTSDVLGIAAKILGNPLPLFYSSGDTGTVFHGLISEVVLPPMSYDETKSLGPSAHILTPVLQKAITGLVSLDVDKDKYAISCLKDVFANYSYRFSAISHPFVTPLNKENGAIREIFLQTVNLKFLTPRPLTMSPDHLQNILSLLFKLLNERSTIWSPLFTEITLEAFLRTMILLEHNSLKAVAADILRKLLFEAQGDTNLRENVTKAFEIFISAELAWNTQKVFRILCVTASLNRALMLDTAPFLYQYLVAVEQKRGVEKDIQLRQGLRSFLTALNITEEKLYRKN